MIGSPARSDGEYGAANRSERRATMRNRESPRKCFIRRTSYDSTARKYAPFADIILMKRAVAEPGFGADQLSGYRIDPVAFRSFCHVDLTVRADKGKSPFRPLRNISSIPPCRNIRNRQIENRTASSYRKDRSPELIFRKVEKDGEHIYDKQKQHRHGRRPRCRSRHSRSSAPKLSDDNRRRRTIYRSISYPYFSASARSKKFRNKSQPREDIV